MLDAGSSALSVAVPWPSAQSWVFFYPGADLSLIGFNMEWTQMSGLDFLQKWVGTNVRGQSADRVAARKLTAKLQTDAAVAGFTMKDLALNKVSVEKYILDAMIRLNEPGIPGD